MIYVIKTNDSDSDFFYLKYSILPKLAGQYTVRKNYDCSEDTGFSQFLNNTGSLSMFASEKTLHVLYDAKTNKKELELLTSLADELIILVNPSKKTFPQSKSFVIYDTPFTLNEIKKYILQQLKDVKLPSSITIDDIIKKISFTDDIGNIHYSPLQAEIIIKQVLLLIKQSPDSLRSFLTTDKEYVDHWQMVAQLFSPPASRDRYFKNLMEIFDIYEILNSLKNSILLMGIISVALKQHIDQASIAKTLGKHPFYIQNLVRTITQFSLDPTKLQALLSRLLLLEQKVKTGEIDDPELGFQFLIATVS